MPNNSHWKADTFGLDTLSESKRTTSELQNEQPQLQHQSQSEQHQKQKRIQPRLVRASSVGFVPDDHTQNVKVTIDFEGDINSMTYHWTPSELRASRRLVHITSRQQYNHLSLQFKPLAQKDYVPGLPVISCIYWRKANRYCLTSVELITLLEQIVHQKFPVEEKNRIRRNLQSIKPLTISKSNENYQEFFDLIMDFNNPKPRHIEKDVKIIFWDHLKEALAKILSKYTVDPTGLDSTIITNTHVLSQTPFQNFSGQLTSTPLMVEPSQQFIGRSYDDPYSSSSPPQLGYYRYSNSLNQPAESHSLNTSFNNSLYEQQSLRAPTPTVAQASAPQQLHLQYQNYPYPFQPQTLQQSCSYSHQVQPVVQLPPVNLQHAVQHHQSQPQRGQPIKLHPGSTQMYYIEATDSYVSADDSNLQFDSYGNPFLKTEFLH